MVKKGVCTDNRPQEIKERILNNNQTRIYPYCTIHPWRYVRTKQGHSHYRRLLQYHSVLNIPYSSQHTNQSYSKHSNQFQFDFLHQSSAHMFTFIYIF